MFPQQEIVLVIFINILEFQNYKVKLKVMYSSSSKVG